MPEEKSKILKNDEKPVQKYRAVFQILFVLLCAWIGIEFYFFVGFLENGGNSDFVSRPPGVDGFLPISSFMSFFLFLVTGEIHYAHPAGFFVFLAILVMSFIFGKSFCSWLCPVGFLSETLGNLGEKISRRKVKMPKFLDYPLRSLKYLLLGFLLYSVFILMGSVAVKAFLNSEYNLVADIKMYYFFAKISQFSLIVLLSLTVLSILFRNFWCRYLCPYGAFLGIFSLLSLNRIKRDKETCTDCKLCSKVCPSKIKVHSVKTSVISDECTFCLECVDCCPVKDTLYIKPAGFKKNVNKKFAAAGIAVLFMLVTGIGMLTNNWQNNLSKEDYKILFKNVESYGHPTGTNSIKTFREDSEKNK